MIRSYQLTLTLIFANILASSLSAQAWDTPLGDYKMENADLILEVKITDRKYVTERGFYTCDVVKVVKGDFKMHQLSLDLELISSDEAILNKRFKAINTKDVVILGFKKDHSTTKTENKYYFGYTFFMSE